MAYSAPARFYHNLDHLDHIVAQLDGVWSSIAHPDALVMAIAYHDFVYRVNRKDNEEQSALAMRDKMGRLGLATNVIERAAAMILATKAHGPSDDADTRMLVDADLSVLGAEPDAYDRYARAVRKEYRRYPDLLYKPGRRKVLQHFLGMSAIFGTAHFHERLEEAARSNLRRELIQLG